MAGVLQGVLSALVLFARPSIIKFFEQQFDSADLYSGCSSLAKNCSVGSYLSPGISRVGSSA